MPLLNHSHTEKNLPEVLKPESQRGMAEVRLLQDSHLDTDAMQLTVVKVVVAVFAQRLVCDLLKVVVVGIQPHRLVVRPPHLRHVWVLCRETGSSVTIKRHRKLKDPNNMPSCPLNEGTRDAAVVGAD